MIRKIVRALSYALALIWLPATTAEAQSLSHGSAPAAVARADTTSAPTNDSTPAFKPSWHFDAWLFGTFTYQTDSATKAASAGNPSSQFTLDRAYLTFTGMVAPDWGFRVTTDVKTLPAGNAIYNGLIIRLKYAYAQWDYLHATTANGLSAWARIGAIHTVVIEDEEHFWPRWLQKTALEYWAIQPGAADYGASTQFTLPGHLGLAYFTVANGPGYQTAVDPDRYKDVALRFSLTPSAKSAGYFKTFQITPWVQIGRTTNATANGATLENNSGGIFIGDADPRLTFGAEYAERQLQTMPATVKVTTTATVWDGFIIVRPGLFADPRAKPWGFLVRYDDWTANTAPESHRTLFLAGAFIDVAKATSVGISYQNDAPHGGAALAPTRTAWELNWQLTF